jgi:hypothetical protein
LRPLQTQNQPVNAQQNPMQSLCNGANHRAKRPGNIGRLVAAEPKRNMEFAAEGASKRIRFALIEYLPADVFR